MEKTLKSIKEKITPGSQGDHPKTDSEYYKETGDSYKNIPGWGIDADPENDPTYPMKHSNGADHDRMNYEKAPQQPFDREVLLSVERPTYSRVFGTSVPPKGLSGVIRRFAFKYSEATLAHWMGLLLADRINVWEGIAEDLTKGHIPNPWLEKGWRSEWKTNRQGVIKKVIVTAVIATAVVAIISKRRKKKIFS